MWNFTVCVYQTLQGARLLLDVGRGYGRVAQGKAPVNGPELQSCFSVAEIRVSWTKNKNNSTETAKLFLLFKQKYMNKLAINYGAKKNCKTVKVSKDSKVKKKLVSGDCLRTNPSFLANGNNPGKLNSQNEEEMFFCYKVPFSFCHLQLN